MKKIIATAFAIALSLTGWDVAEAVPLTHTFDDPTISNVDLFGASIALDGNHALVGAPHDDTDGSIVGQVHLFDVNTGTLLHTFSDPSVTGNDLFGASVALKDNYALVGAYKDDTSGPDVGQVHLFDVATGSLVRTFRDPSATSRDWFGFSVALDGNYALVGAPLDDTSGTDVGQAHLFDLVTGALLHTFSDPTVTAFDRFGISVALDGNHALIGAEGDDTSGPEVGQAHLFDVTTGNLIHTFNNPTVTGSIWFGRSVALDGNHALFGVPFDNTSGTSVGQAHLFDVTSGSLIHTFNDPTVTSGDNFGSSIALDGNRALIGAPWDDTKGSQVGQAHLFDVLTGKLIHTFDDPTVTSSDNFGSAVALDGTYVLIGAEGHEIMGLDVGQAHLYTIPEPRSIAILFLAGLTILVRQQHAARYADGRDRRAPT
jgi:WD40 repeat protein